MQCEEEKCHEWKSAFLQMDLKRKTVSRMSVLKNSFNLYAVSSFLSTHAHFSAPPYLGSCMFKHIHSRELRYNRSLQLRGAERLQPSSWGSRASLTVVVEGKIGILVIQTFHRGRVSLEAQKMSLVELKLKVQKEGVFIWVVTLNNKATQSALLEIEKKGKI